MLQHFSYLLKDHDLRPHDKILLSPFAPLELLHYLLSLDVEIIFYETTLEGMIDFRSLKKEVVENFKLFIYTPFYGYEYDLAVIKKFCEIQSISFLHIANSFKADTSKVFSLYTNTFAKTKDFTHLSTYYSSEIFPIFLLPQFFCPKEDIIDALKLEKVDVVLLSLLYKDKRYLETHKEVSLFGAGECQRSFIGLPLTVSIEQATEIAKLLLRILDTHSLRRCTF